MEKAEKFERIKKYSSSISCGNYGMRIGEMSAICDCSTGIYDMIIVAFEYGFARGCRKTKNDLAKMKRNQKGVKQR